MFDKLLAQRKKVVPKQDLSVIIWEIVKEVKEIRQKELMSKASEISGLTRTTIFYKIKQLLGSRVEQTTVLTQQITPPLLVEKWMRRYCFYELHPDRRKHNEKDILRDFGDVAHIDI